MLLLPFFAYSAQGGLGRQVLLLLSSRTIYLTGLIRGEGDVRAVREVYVIRPDNNALLIAAMTTT